MESPIRIMYNMAPLNNCIGLSTLFAFSRISGSEKPRKRNITAMYNPKNPSIRLTARFL